MQVVVIGVLIVVVGFLFMTRMKGSSPRAARRSRCVDAGRDRSATGAPAATDPAAGAACGRPILLRPRRLRSRSGRRRTAAGATSDFKAGPGLPKPVVNAYDGGNAIALLVTKQKGVDDKADAQGTSARSGARATSHVFTVRVHDVANYSRIAQGVDLDRVPALVVIQPKKLAGKGASPSATVSYGFRTPAERRPGGRRLPLRRQAPGLLAQVLTAVPRAALAWHAMPSAELLDHYLRDSTRRGPEPDRRIHRRGRRLRLRRPGPHLAAPAGRRRRRRQLRRRRLRRVARLRSRAREEIEGETGAGAARARRRRGSPISSAASTLPRSTPPSWSPTRWAVRSRRSPRSGEAICAAPRRRAERVLVAFSGGVDSTVAALARARARGRGRRRDPEALGRRAHRRHPGLLLARGGPRRPQPRPSHWESRTSRSTSRTPSAARSSACSSRAIATG